MQKVGKICKICNKKIMFDNHAVACNNCGDVFHIGCMPEANICPSCGETISNDKKEHKQTTIKKKSNVVKNILVGVTVFIVVFALFGGFKNLINLFTEVKIERILNDPQKYEGKKITVTGIVDDRYSKTYDSLSELEGYQYYITQGKKKLMFKKSKMFMNALGMQNGDKITIKGTLTNGFLDDPDVKKYIK